MYRLICWVRAKIRFERFLNRNAYLKNAITREDKKVCVKALARHFYRAKNGEK